MPAKSPSGQTASVARVALRAALIGALCLELLAGLAGLYLSYLFGGPAATEAAAAGVFVPSSLVVLASALSGQWSEARGLRMVQWAGSLGVAITNAAAAVAGASDDALLAFALLAVAAGALVLAVTSARRARPAHSRAEPALVGLGAAGMVTAFAAGGAVLVVATSLSRLDCHRLPGELSAWHSPGAGSEDGGRAGITEREQIAEALIRCRTLQGATRADVRRLLGPPPGGRLRYRSWKYSVGQVNNAIGPGEPQSLAVKFSRSGRVRRVFFVYSPETVGW